MQAHQERESRGSGAIYRNVDAASEALQSITIIIIVIIIISSGFIIISSISISFDIISIRISSFLILYLSLGVPVGARDGGADGGRRQPNPGHERKQHIEHNHT